MEEAIALKPPDPSSALALGVTQDIIAEASTAIQILVRMGEAVQLPILAIARGRGVIMGKIALRLIVLETLARMEEYVYHQILANALMDITGMIVEPLIAMTILAKMTEIVYPPIPAIARMPMAILVPIAPCLIAPVPARMEENVLAPIPATVLVITGITEILAHNLIATKIPA